MRRSLSTWVRSSSLSCCLLWTFTLAPTASAFNSPPNDELDMSSLSAPSIQLSSGSSEKASYILGEASLPQSAEVAASDSLISLHGDGVVWSVLSPGWAFSERSTPLSSETEYVLVWKVTSVNVEPATTGTAKMKIFAYGSDVGSKAITTDIVLPATGDVWAANTTDTGPAATNSNEEDCTVCPNTKAVDSADGRLHELNRSDVQTFLKDGGAVCDENAGRSVDDTAAPYISTTQGVTNESRNHASFGADPRLA